MNRIVLIGNGFDLAHGLNTSYKYFICWYMNQWGSRLLNGIGKEESDGLLSMQIKDGILDRNNIQPTILELQALYGLKN